MKLRYIGALDQIEFGGTVICRGEEFEAEDAEAKTLLRQTTNYEAVKETPPQRDDEKDGEDE